MKYLIRFFKLIANLILWILGIVSLIIGCVTFPIYYAVYYIIKGEQISERTSEFWFYYVFDFLTKLIKL